MSNKIKTLYVCQECGGQSPRWEGQCRHCQQWNTLVEEKIAAKSDRKSRGWNIGDSNDNKTVTAVAVTQSVPSNKSERRSTGQQELDRVLGGGLMSGSYILLGGDPGIGKSTLLLQTAGHVAAAGGKVLYVSGEESVEQTGLRARRLGIQTNNLLLAAESQLENIIALAKTHLPDMMVVDSIQTVYLGELQSAPGSVAQVRECASYLMGLAKSQNMTIFLVGHVTKDGNIAGPKVLEHMVDTVLSFEGDSSHQYRLLRALKNRFGATNELGVFQMDSGGLSGVANPSEIFLEERAKDVSGSAVFAAMEGTRPLLCEVQALSSPTPTTFPRRTALGVDVNRVHLLAAVLQKHLSMDFSQSDIYVNVVGGLKLSEPAADLAMAAALISSHQQKNIKQSVVFAGEIGLTGEIRGISFSGDRLKEAEKLGFKFFVLPQSNRKHLKSNNLQIEPIFAGHVSDLAQIIKSVESTKEKRSDANRDASPGRQPAAMTSI